MCDKNLYIKSILGMQCTRCGHDCKTHYPLQVRPSVRPSVTHNNNIETVGVFDVQGTPITNQSTRQTSLVKRNIVYTHVHDIRIIRIVCVCKCASAEDESVTATGSFIIIIITKTGARRRLRQLPNRIRTCTHI